MEVCVGTGWCRQSEVEDLNLGAEVTGWTRASRGVGGIDG